MEVYRYHPISSPRSIRVLTLYPGDWKADLQLSLSEISLDDDPVYEVLSYTWTDEDGNKDPISPIYIESKQLLVTPNCAAALRRLRKGVDGGQPRQSYSKSRRKAAHHGGNQARALWIDAVCINQEDVAERNQQVAMMKDVYEKAACVIVWLGEGSCWRQPRTGRPYTSYALDWITWKGKLLRNVNSCKDTPKARVHTVCDTIRYDRRRPWKRIGLDITTDVFKALFLLFTRSWWRCAWVIQEVALAKSAVLLCGDSLTDWRNLKVIIDNCDGWEAFERISRPAIALDQTATGTPFYDKSLTTTANHPLLTTIHNLIRFQASDPRDKVFAFYGLQHFKKIFVSEPDYSHSMEEVFSQATVKVLDYTKSLDLFGRHLARTSVSDLPTWALDWRTPGIVWLNISAATRGAANGSSAQLKYSPYSKVIQLRGTIVGFIAVSLPVTTYREVDWSRLTDYQRLNVLDNVSQWFKLAQEKYQMVDRMPMDEFAIKLFTALTGRRTSAQFFWDDGFWGFLTSWQLLLKSSASEQLRILRYRSSPVALAVSQITNNLSLGRTFGWTEAGLMASLPRRTQPRDEVAIFCGGQVPFVIRNENSGKHRLVGSCYIHDMLEGSFFPDNQEDLEWITLV